MRIDFLSAADGTPLTKNYTKDGDGWETTAYPMVKDFRSRSTEIATTEELFLQVSAHAPTHCALKGQLVRPLEGESRAGLTAADQPTEWILLDYDTESGFDSVDEMLAAIDPALADVSYVWQHSSSSGLRKAPGLRGHAFVLLAEPARPGVIKEWLKHKNLTVPSLRSQVELTASGFAVRWPLDITTCQSDKLIYISPPNIEGADDPLAGQRFQLVAKTNDRATIDFRSSAAVNQEALDALVAELRAAAGLKKRKARYKAFGAGQLMTNPDRAVVTGERQQRGFTYLNLNGGDSWAYYFPSDNPEVLHNFKGEPPCLLQAVCPDYYQAYIAALSPDEAPTQPVVFRDRETDTYYNGLYTENPEALELYQVGSLQKIEHFLAQYGKPMPEYLEDWAVRFDPRTMKVIDKNKRWANLFSPSDHLRAAQTADPVEALPPIAERVLRSICVDQETFEYFLNWLAWIFQTRDKAGTAWIFHGVPGTGKGVLFERILQPLFGHRYAHIYTTQTIEELYNANLEREIITFLDEFRLDDGHQATKLMNKVKNLITERHAMIRGMRSNPVQRQIFNNVIIATNHEDSTPLEQRDRRFNVAPPQDTPLFLSQEDLEALDEELPVLAAYLQHYETDERKVRTPLLNSSRERTIAASETSINRFFRAVREGDFDYFFEYAAGAHTDAAPDLRQLTFGKVVRAWARQLGTKTFVTRDELRAAYNYLQGANLSATKFARMCKIYGVEITPGRANGKLVRGVATTLETQYPSDVAAYLAEDGAPAVSAVTGAYAR